MTTKKGISCLQVAASLGNKEAVDLLLKFNANVEHVDNSRGWNALHFAAWGDYKEIVDTLVKKNPKLGMREFSDCN